MIDKLNNKFRGFAFISYCEPQDKEGYDDGRKRVLQFQKTNKHIIRGKTVQVKEALTKEQSR